MVVILDIEYSKDAIKAMKRFDKPTRNRIATCIKKLPLGDIKKLRGFSNYYRLRVGDYRILFQLLDNGITVIDVLPRGEAYKNL